MRMSPLFFAPVLLPASALAQDAKPIFDGRLSLKPAALSPAEDDLMRTRILPAARKAWQERQRLGLCAAGQEPRAIDAASGAFTRAGAEQRAILYAF